MKKIYTLSFSLLLFHIAIMAQSPSWQWAQTAVVSNYPNAVSQCMATDKSGNIYVGGYFYSDTITFGSFTLYNFRPSRPIAGDTTDDLYLVKYAPDGTVLWAKSAQGNSYDEAIGIATDENGNVLVTGQFRSSSLNFGSVILNKEDSSTAYVFLAKYDSNGNTLWARSAGGYENDAGGYDVSVDGNGEPYITGYYECDTISFGTSQLINYVQNLPEDGSDDIFTVKYDVNGNVLWAATAGGNDYDDGNAIAVDDSGNAYVTGYFYSDTCFFGSQYVVNVDTSRNTDDMFLVKYNNSGTVLWAKRAGGDNDDEGNFITIYNNNPYIVGDFYSDTLAIGGTALVNHDNTENTNDIFLTEYNLSGVPVWANSTGGNGSDYSPAIATDNSGNLYITGGYYSTTLYAGSFSVNNFDPTGNTEDILFEACSSTGNVEWLKSVGGNSYDEGIADATDASGNVYLAGYYQSSSIDFGGNVLTLISNNYVYPFIAKYGTSENGINEVNPAEVINLYPDPASAILIAESDAFNSQMVPAIFDITGRQTAVPFSFTGNRFLFDTRLLAPGMYWVRFNINGEQATGKFVKM